LHCGDNSGNVCGDDGFGARAGAAGVITGFESDVESCATGAFAGLFERDDFRVVAPIVLVEAFAENCAVFYDYAADGWVGAGEADAFAREVQRVFHESNVVGIHGFN
jgi:hypothetical protein